MSLPGMTSESLDIDDLLAHSGWVRSLAIRLLRDSNSADDVVQETWVAALRHPPEAGRPLRPWLATVVRNLVRRKHRTDQRRSRREQDAPRPSTSEAGDDLLAAVEEQQRLARDVMALPEPYRGVLLRRYWREMEPVEIARALGVPAATVRSQLHRGLAMLRESVQERFGGEHRAMCLALFSIGGEGGTRALLPLAATAKGVWIMSETSKLLWAAALAVGALIGGWRLYSSTPENSELPAAGITTNAGLERSEQVLPAASMPMPLEIALASREQRTAIAATVPPAEPTQADVTEIRARFVDHAGAPVAGVVLSAVVHGTEYSARSATDGRTLLSFDELGTQRFRSLQWRTTLEVHAAGRVTLFLRIASQDEAIELGDITLEPAARVSGHVVDERDRPIANALVQVSDAPRPGSPDRARRAGPTVGEGLPEARTDSNGRFFVDGIQPGNVRLWATLEEQHYSYSDSLEVRAGDELPDITLVLAPLDEAHRIAGRVVDPDGVGIPRIYVMYQLAGTFSSDQIVSSDDDGFFEIPATEQARYELTFSSPTASHTMTVVEDVLPGTTDLLVTLSKTHYLNLRVTDPEGEPVTDFKTEVELVRGHHQFYTTLRDSENADWKRLAIPDEPYTLVVKAKGFEPQLIGPLDPAVTPEVLEVRLRLGEVFHGRVTHGGAPLANARVAIHRSVEGTEQVVHGGFVQRVNPRPEAHVVTDADGRFTLDRLEFGSAVLLASFDGLATAEAGPFARDVDPGALELALTAGGAIVGRVHPRPGQSALGQLVTASRGDGTPRSTRTDSEGRYRFDALTPGAWFVTWHTRESAQSTNYSSSRSPLVFEGNCIVIEGRETVHDIDLAHLSMSTLRGRVLFDGEAPRGWSAQLEHIAMKDLYEPLRPVPIGSDGSFEITTFQGTYRLSIEHAEAEETVRSLNETLKLDRPLVEWSFERETGGLHGAVLVAGPAPLVRLSQTNESGQVWALTFRPAPSGDFELEGLPSGTLRMHALRQLEGEGYERWHSLGEIRVAVGESNEFVEE